MTKPSCPCATIQMYALSSFLAHPPTSYCCFLCGLCRTLQHHCADRALQQTEAFPVHGCTSLLTSSVTVPDLPALDLGTNKDRVVTASQGCICCSGSSDQPSVLAVCLSALPSVLGWSGCVWAASRCGWSRQTGACRARWAAPTWPSKSSKKPARYDSAHVESQCQLRQTA